MNQIRFGPALAVLMTLFLTDSNTPASILDPGSSIRLHRANEPRGAQLLATTNSTFSSAGFTGTLTSKVWAGDDSNPWGGLTFSYLLANSGDCAETLGLFTLSGFAGMLVDVNCFGSGVAPRQAMSSASGERISFGFFNHAGDATLQPGETSNWLIIQTSSGSWGINDLISLGTAEVNAASFTPTSVPEPTAATLLLLAGVVAARRCKRFRH